MGANISTVMVGGRKRTREAAAASRRVDLPAYYQALRRETRDCLYLVADSACPALRPRMGEVGHHFDGNYRALSDVIVDRLDGDTDTPQRADQRKVTPASSILR